jgi:hypothetical protein
VRLSASRIEGEFAFHGAVLASPQASTRREVLHPKAGSSSPRRGNPLHGGADIGRA